MAGIDFVPYSGHSFRSGAATTAAKQGISDATIKMLGRWKSSAYQLRETVQVVHEHAKEGKKSYQLFEHFIVIIPLN